MNLRTELSDRPELAASTTPTASRSFFAFFCVRLVRFCKQNCANLANNSVHSVFSEFSNGSKHVVKCAKIMRSDVVQTTKFIIFK